MWNGDVTGMGKKLKGNACSAFVIIQLKKYTVSAAIEGNTKKIRICLTFLLFENHLAKPAEITKYPFLKKS
mgnify:CR=1 FL=1